MKKNTIISGVMPRKPRQRLVQILFLALLLLLLAGCGAEASQKTQSSLPAATQAPETETITITDMLGRRLELEGPAQKIIALQASEVEILYALGAGDQVVGIGEYCNYPAEAMEKEVLASGSGTSIEAIIALEPDLLIMGTMDQSDAQIAQLENAGIKVLVTDPQDLAGTYTAIHRIGQATGRLDEAEKMIESMKTEFAAMQAKAADKQKAMQGEGARTIYFEVSPLEYGLWTSGRGTFMQEITDILGVKNIFDDLEGWLEISEEQVIQRDPDYIVTISMNFGEGPSPEEEIMGRKGWQDISAIKKQQVFHGDSDQLTRPGPRLVDGAQALYAYLYGE